MSSSQKRSMDREGSPVSKRSRSRYGPDHDMMRDGMSPPEFDRQDSHRGKNDPRDGPPPPAPGYRPEFMVQDGPPPPRLYDNRVPPQLRQGPPKWAPKAYYRSLYISNIPSKVPDQMLQECLIDNYKRFGEMNVKVTMSYDQRVAYLNFRYPKNARKALMKGIKFLFDRELKITPVFKTDRHLCPSRNVPPDIGSRPPEPNPSRHSPPPYDRRLPPPDGGRGEFRPDPPPSGPPHEEETKSEKFPCHLNHVDPEYDDKATRTLFGEKEHISRSHSLPDYHYSPVKGYGPLPEHPPGPWRGLPPDGPERQHYEDWQRGQCDYRATSPGAYRGDVRRHDDYNYERDVERHREQPPEYAKRSYHVGQRSPERGREYRGKSGEEDFRLSERRDYRTLSPDRDYIDNQCRTLADLTKFLPVAWNGALILKSSSFATRMHVVSGDVTLVDTLMRDPVSTESPVLKIIHRLRLDQPKLDDVGRQIQAAGPRGHCILLAVPSSLSNYEDTAAAIQKRPLKNLVTYLKQKEAAGVMSLPPFPIQGRKDVGVLHAFPPCDFGFNFLKNRAAKLSPETAKEDHLVIVVVYETA